MNPQMAILIPVIVIGGIFWLYVRIKSRKRTPASRSLAQAKGVEPLTPAGVTKSARRLCGYTQRRPDLDKCGVLLGRLIPDGPDLRISMEDDVLAIMGKRAGKTTGPATSGVLNAPGACVATTNKGDLYLTTSQLRARHGHIWTFDPQDIVNIDPEWWWNPLADLHTVEDAVRFAAHFVGIVEDKQKREIWGPLAIQLLSALCLAAAKDGGHILDVWRWLNNHLLPEPEQLLRHHGYDAVADGLANIQGSAERTRTSVYITALAGVQCLRDPRITEWVTPNHDIHKRPQFQPHDFVTSTDTIYLLSKEGGGSAAPLIAALVDSIFRAATTEAEYNGGRLPVPLIAILDEAANGCPIADLPAQISHLAGRGIIVCIYLQSYAQGAEVWGHGGMRALWGAVSAKLIGAGGDDASFGRDISTLVGEHDIPITTYSYNRRDSTKNRSTRKERILTAGDIREIPRGQALLLANGCKPALIRLLPWFEGPRAREIQAAFDQAERALRTRVRSHT